MTWFYTAFYTMSAICIVCYVVLISDRISPGPAPVLRGQRAHQCVVV